MGRHRGDHPTASSGGVHFAGESAQPHPVAHPMKKQPHVTGLECQVAALFSTFVLCRRMTQAPQRGSQLAQGLWYQQTQEEHENRCRSHVAEGLWQQMQDDHRQGRGQGEGAHGPHPVVAPSGNEGQGAAADHAHQRNENCPNHRKQQLLAA